MQYIEMCLNFNTYHNVKTYKRFYIVSREQLNNNNYELCHTEWNNRFSYEYDFYRQKDFDGGLYYVAVRKPLYRIITDLQTIECDYWDTFYLVDKKHYMNYDEVTAKELKSGNLIRLNEFDEVQEIYSITEY